jgi:hydroxymethylbilane synthase
VLCGTNLESLPEGARVGTGSPRRTAQLAALRPDLSIEDIRGNIDTRLGKVSSGEFDAVVLAEAGLNRIGRQSEIAHRFEVSEMVPAPAQGALALEVMADSDIAEIVAHIDHAPSRVSVEAERSLLARTGAGCRAALGAVALHDAGELIMHGFVEDEQGRRTAQVRHAGGLEASRLLQEELRL